MSRPAEVVPIPRVLGPERLGTPSVGVGLRSIDELTKNATCGRQKMAVAYQFPKAVVGSSTAGMTGCFTQSSSFFVAWIVYTGTSVSCS